MKPELFQLPFVGFSIHTYGVLLAVAFLLALWVGLKGARREGLPRDPVLDLWIISLISGIVGAKLLLFLLGVDYSYYLHNPGAAFQRLLHYLNIFANWRELLGGLRAAGVFYGGLVVAVAVCLLMIWRRGLPGWKLADISAPAIALGQSVGRVGCFAAGCCYGKVTDLPWAVTFTDPMASEITGVPLAIPLHPSQLYLSVANLALFGFLILLSRRKSYDGQVFLWYLLLYALMRGLLEFTRGDPRGQIWGVSTSQVIALAAVIISLILFQVRRRSLGASRKG